MTLIIALICKEGIVFVSDGLTTTGIYQQPAIKIKCLSKNKLWGGAGSWGLIKKIEEELCCSPKIYSASLGDKQLQKIIKDKITNLRKEELDKQRQVSPGGTEKYEIASSDLLFVEYSNNKPVIWHIDSDCNDERLEEFFCGCVGHELAVTVAQALLRPYQPYLKNLSLDQTKFIAYMILRIAIDVVGGGIIGDPIQLWRINNKGYKQVSNREMKGLRDNWAWWVEYQVKIIVEYLFPPKQPKK